MTRISLLPHVFRVSAPLLLIMAGCGGAISHTETPGTSQEVIDMEEMRIEARGGPDGVSVVSYDAETLFRRASVFQEDGRCLDAVALYDQLFEQFPSSRYVSPSLYNAGFCLREDGDHAGAAVRLERLLEVSQDATDVQHGRFLLTESYLILERYGDGVTLSETLLDDRTLTPEERLEAMSYLARALLGAERFEDAARQARASLAFYRRRAPEGQIRDQGFAAAANFVLAETIRLRASAMEIPVAAVEVQREVLEARATLILEAQREYFAAIQFQIPEWSAPSGYRIGSMYDGLWTAIMESPLPPPRIELPPGSEEEYEREYRLEMARLIEDLMRHAVRYWQLTLDLIERTREGAQWLERLREDLDRARARLDNPLVDLPERPTEAEGAQDLAAPQPTKP